MTPDRSQQLVIGCLAASAAIGAGNAVADGRPPELRQVVGFAFVGVGLATAALFTPGLAGGFAVLVLTSTALLYGGPLYEAVTAVTSTAGHAAGVHPSSTRTTRTKREVVNV